jgi:hypothetical protein
MERDPGTARPTNLDAPLLEGLEQGQDRFGQQGQDQAQEHGHRNTFLHVEYLLFWGRVRLWTRSGSARTVAWRSPAREQEVYRRQPLLERLVGAERQEADGGSSRTLLYEGSSM